MSNALKPVTAGTLPLSSDVDQLRRAFAGASDVGTLSFAPAQSTPSTPTATSSGTTGNLNGAYRWIVVVVTGWQQSNGSYYVSGFAPTGESASTTITNQSANVGLPLGTGSPVIGRAIYRTAAGGASGSEKFAGIVWDNTTTTWTDNIADGSLGTGMPISSSNPAAYGTAIPANVPVGNTTGTKLDGYGNAYTLANILNEQYNFNASLQGSRAGWASFSRNSNANMPYAVGPNVPRYAPSKFGEGIFIEEGTTNLVENSDFETFTTAPLVFSDTFATDLKAWTTNGTINYSVGSITASGNATMIAGNPNWKPIKGSGGQTLALSAFVAFTTPATLIASGSDYITVYLYQDANNFYYATLLSNGSGQAYIDVFRVQNGGAPTEPISTAATTTFSASTKYTLALSLDSGGNLTANLRTGDVTSGSTLISGTAVDSSPLPGPFKVQVAPQASAVNHVQVFAPFADAWTIEADTRVAWALTNANPTSGTYSVSAEGVAGVTAGIYTTTFITASASTEYTASMYANSTNAGAAGAWISMDWKDSTATAISSTTSAKIAGTTATERIFESGQSPSNTAKVAITIGVGDAGTYYFDAIQLEQKAYATSYLRNDNTSGSVTRANESVSVASSLLSLSQGAIYLSVDVTANSKDTSMDRYVVLSEPNTSAIWQDIFYFRHSKATNTWDFAMGNHSAAAASDLSVVSVPDTDIAVGQHDICLRWNSSSMDLLVDGTQIGTLANPKLPTIAGAVFIGCYYDGTDNFDGTVGGLMFFSTTLTDAQVADLYNLTQPAQDALGTGLGGVMTVNDLNTRSLIEVQGSGSITINATTWTKVAFSSKIKDNLNEYDPTTNYRFTAKNAGDYLIHAEVGFGPFSTSDTPDRVILAVYKNGSFDSTLYDGTIAYVSSNAFATPAGATQVRLNAGDYMEIYCYVTSSVSTAGSWLFRSTQIA